MFTSEDLKYLFEQIEDLSRGLDNIQFAAKRIDNKDLQQILQIETNLKNLYATLKKLNEGL